MTILSALTSWALEGGIVTADSMGSRGFGAGKRSCFALYRWQKRDKILLILLLMLLALIAFCLTQGAASAEFLPQIRTAAWNDPWTLAALTAYSIFLLCPTILNFVEEMTWRILKSTI